MTNVPAAFGTTLSVVVLAIIFGIIVFAAGVFFYYRKKWAAEKEKGEGKDVKDSELSSTEGGPKRAEILAAMQYLGLE